MVISISELPSMIKIQVLLSRCITPQEIILNPMFFKYLVFHDNNPVVLYKIHQTL